MKMTLLFAVISFVLFSCETSYDSKATENLEAYIQKITDNKISSLESKVYLVSPLEGCSPCIDKTVKFIKSNLNEKDISFVVSHDTEKPITFKFSQDELSQENVLIDNRSVAVSSGVIRSNPSVYYIKEGKVVEYKHLHPSEVDTAFVKILNWIHE